jgi:phosphatidylglycerophosphate synthase
MTTATWQLPDRPLRTSVVATNAAAIGAVFLVATAGTAALGLSSIYAAKAVAVLLIVELVATGRVGASHPFSNFGLANQITTIRACMVALVAGLVGEPASGAMATAAACAALAVTALDGADGWIARRSRMASAFGARFDMEVDALLILALAVLAWEFGKAGAWIVLAGLMRYVFVAAGWVIPRMSAALPPSRRRQAVCVVQIVGLGLLMLPAVQPPASAWAATALLATLLYSFAIDVIWLWRRV